MTRYAENRLSVTLPVRINPVLYKLLEQQAYREVVCNAGLVRIAITEYLKGKGIQIPKPMDGWQELAKREELRKALEGEKKAFSQLPPIS